MFYADAVAALLAHDRVAELRLRGDEGNRAARHRMAAWGDAVGARLAMRRQRMALLLAR